MARRGTSRVATLIAAIVVMLIPGLALAQGSGGAHEGHDVATSPGSDPLGDIVVAFELTDRDGNIVTAKDFEGRYVLLGFGFTHCPHICPMMVLNMGKALKETSIEAAGIFVSVDTERDSPTITDDYASKFGDSMIGLGGSIEQINAAASNFKVSYQVGSGAMPLEELPSTAVALNPDFCTADELARNLRCDPEAVVGRIHRDRLLLDMRTVRDDELGAIAAALERIAAGAQGRAS